MTSSTPHQPARPTARQRQQAADERRDRARTAREAAERAARRRRRTVVGLCAIAGLLVIALVVAAIVSTRQDDGPVAAPAGTTEQGGVLVGDPAAEHTVVVYYDYQCPFCAQFEAQTGPWLAEQREAGALAVEYRPISFLDEASQGYSTRAAAAAACVAGDSGADFAAFTDDLFAQQPEEGGSGLPEEVVLQAARDAGAGEEATACITDGTYAAWAEQTTQRAIDSGVTSTPTVLVDGQALQTQGLPAQADIEAALAS